MDRGLPVRIERVKVEHEGGLEAAARLVRYQALERLADETDCQWIATGHTASDQAETVLLRLGRGAGARGAGGILERRGRVLRPMLNVSRREVLDFLQQRGAKPLVNDPSNQDLTRARNRIRHQVLPELRFALGDGVERALARFARFAREDEAVLAQLANLPNPAPRNAVSGLPAAIQRRWVRKACESLGHKPNAVELLTATTFLARCAHKRTELRVELGRKIEIRCERDQFVVAKAKPASKQASKAVSAPLVELVPNQTVSLDWAGLQLRLSEAAPAVAKGSMELALPQQVAMPLRVRPRLPGDRITPLGGGSRKLKRLLIDEGVPREQRERLAVVTDALGNVLWVVGLRVAEAARAGQGAELGWLLCASSQAG